MDLAVSTPVTGGFDYIGQLKSEMVRVLPTRSSREKDAFARLCVDEQAWRFLNWQSRLVHPHPRQVNKAEGFDNSPIVQTNRPSIEALLTSLARGDNVNSHLSHDIMQGYCTRPPGRKHGPDFDLLLNEWGIHHLHLGQAPGKNGFKTRTDEQLFVIFGRGVAFVLLVARHGAWTNRDLIEATVRSWPNQGLFVNLPGVLLGRGWTEDEHKGLRKVGATTAAVVNDKCWMSGVTGGITTALVSTRLSRETAQLLRQISHANEHPDHLLSLLKRNAAMVGVAWPSRPSISLRWLAGPNRYCFAFLECSSFATVLVDTALNHSG